LIGYAEHVVELASLYLDREGHVDVDLRTTVILLLIAFGRHSFTRQTTTGPRWRRGAVVSVVRAGVTTSYRTSCTTMTRCSGEAYMSPYHPPSAPTSWETSVPILSTIYGCQPSRCVERVFQRPPFKSAPWNRPMVSYSLLTTWLAAWRSG